MCRGHAGLARPAPTTRARVGSRPRLDPETRTASRIGTVALMLAACGALATALATPARATVHLSHDHALALAFPGARTEAMTWVLTDIQARAIEQRAKVKVRTKLLAATAGFRGDTLAGVAFFDSRTVRTMPGVFMVVIAPDTTVERIDVVAFHEPPDYLPSSRWLGLFARRRIGDGLWAGRDIRNLSGASLSARAVTESARLALAVYELVVAPDLARRRSKVR